MAKGAPAQSREARSRADQSCTLQPGRLSRRGQSPVSPHLAIGCCQPPRDQPSPGATPARAQGALCVQRRPRVDLRVCFQLRWSRVPDKQKQIQNNLWRAAYF